MHIYTLQWVLVCNSCLRNAFMPSDSFVLFIFMYKNVQEVQVITSFCLSFSLESLPKIQPPPRLLVHYSLLFYPHANLKILFICTFYN